LWREFERFCGMQKINLIGIAKWNPIQEEVICNFVVYRSMVRGLSSRTLKSLISALKKEFQRREWVWPGTYKLQWAIRGIQLLRASLDVPKQAYPISYEEISKIVQYELVHSESTYRDRVLWAQILVAFFGALRMDDIFSPNIKMKEISITAGGHLHIYRSLGDKTSKSPIILMIPPNKNNLSCCPVRAVQDLIQQRIKARGNVGKEVPLFAYQITGTRPSSKKYLCKRLRQILGQKVTGHSFRRGRISHMISMDISEQKIRNLSRHVTKSINFPKYIDKTSLDFHPDFREQKRKIH
jgi:site-specific recombinase XerC